MTKIADLIGTFAPVPGTAGFEIPVFRSRRSDMMQIQDLDEAFVVRAFIPYDFASISDGEHQPTAVRVGEPGIFAVRCPDGLLRVGTQTDLKAILKPMIDQGALDAMPMLRFRLSAFCRLTERLADDAQMAWTWLCQSSSQWAADAWKLEGTILPEMRRSIAARLRAAGETAESIQEIQRGLEIEIRSDRATPRICLPLNLGRATRCRDLLEGADTLLGDAILWWPELKSCPPQFVSAQGRDQETTSPRRIAEVLKEAKNFLDSQLFSPVLNSRSIPASARNVVTDTRVRVSQFEKVGDLVLYIDRFSKQRGGQLALELATPHVSMEDIHDEFMRRFGRYQGYRSDISDLVPGRSYSASFISIISRKYTNRGGGIYPVGKLGQHKAVLVKATISGKEYENQWMEDGVRLKYFLQGRRRDGRKVYDERSAANRSIVDYGSIPILVFVRNQGRRAPYTYRGVFENKRVVTEPDGRKWFDLVKRDSRPT